jgi:hypothetical protein
VISLAIVLGATTLIGLLIALWQRSEARAASARAAFVEASRARLEVSLRLEAEGRADDVRRLEDVVGSQRRKLEALRALAKDLLRDPAAAGAYLDGVLSDVSGGDVPGHGVVPSPGADPKR